MGDAYAFDELISKYRLLIKSIAFHILQHRQDVEDCENESMTRIWQAICNNMYRYDGSFKAYIATITTNVAITMLKKKCACCSSPEAKQVYCSNSVGRNVLFRCC